MEELKVYCKNCKYQRYNCSEYMCLAHPYYKDTFLEKSKSYLRCEDVNPYNNCKMYKENFWGKIWKSLVNGTSN